MLRKRRYEPHIEHDCSIVYCNPTLYSGVTISHAVICDGQVKHNWSIPIPASVLAHLP